MVVSELVEGMVIEVPMTESRETVLEAWRSGDYVNVRTDATDPGFYQWLSTDEVSVVAAA